MQYRLEGLSRFMNCLVRHPILKNDPIVLAFITEPSVNFIFKMRENTKLFFLFLLLGMEKVEKDE